MLQTVTVLNVTITNESKKTILEFLYQRLKNAKEKTFITTPNPEMLVYASRHLAYQDKLNSAAIALADGVGLFFACSFMGEPLQERITGVDFIEELCKVSREKPISMGFLGGKAGVAERAIDCLKKKYPWIDVVFAGEEWHQEKTIKPFDILFVAFGVPKQEEWIYKNLPSLPVKAAMGVGGAFDYLSGTVTRAPFIVRYLGMEWLFRLFRQPWRWKRQLALINFVFLVFKKRFSK